LTAWRRRRGRPRSWAFPGPKDMPFSVQSLRWWSSVQSWQLFGSAGEERLPQLLRCPPRMREVLPYRPSNAAPCSAARTPLQEADPCLRGGSSSTPPGRGACPPMGRIPGTLPLGRTASTISLGGGLLRLCSLSSATNPAAPNLWRIPAREWPAGEVVPPSPTSLNA